MIFFINLELEYFLFKFLIPRIIQLIVATRSKIIFFHKIKLTLISLRKEVEREYNMLRNTELRDQKKMMQKWKGERDDMIKAQKSETDAIQKACNASLDKTHKDRF